MDESAYRQVLTTSIAYPCPFEKSILTHCAGCSKAEKHNVAEREAVGCSRVAGYNQCLELYGALRHSFSFALHRTHAEGPLTHAQEMRVQCGGLKGLRFIMDGSTEIDDVDAMVTTAWQTYGGWDALPHTEIVHWAAESYRHR